MHRSIIERFVNNQSVLASVRPKAIDAPTVVINISVIIITTHTLCIRRVCVCVSVCQLLIFGHSGQSTAAPSGGPGRGKERKKKTFHPKMRRVTVVAVVVAAALSSFSLVGVDPAPWFCFFSLRRGRMAKEGALTSPLAAAVPVI